MVSFSKVKTNEKRIGMQLKKIGILCGSVCLIIFGAAVAFYNVSLNKRSRIHMTKFPKSDGNKKKGDDSLQFSGVGGTKEEQEWFHEAGEEVYITSDDGLKLHAHMLKNETAGNKFVITCHGFSSRGEHMAGFAKHFYDMGFHVLVPDARAHGTSEGDIMGMGWLDRKDMQSWIQYIRNETPDAAIVLHGVSMGGAAVMMTAGEKIPSNVKAVIADCGYTSVYDIYEYQLKSRIKMLAFPIINTASLISRVKAGYDFKEASSVAQMKKCKTPVLFIQGEKDSMVPSEMLHELYHAANCEKEMLMVKGADHGASNAADPVLYWDTVQAFIQKHI